MELYNIQTPSISDRHSQNALKRIDAKWRLIEESPRQFVAESEPLLSRVEERSFDQLNPRTILENRLDITYKQDGTFGSFIPGTVFDRKA